MTDPTRCQAIKREPSACWAEPPDPNDVAFPPPDSWDYRCTNTTKPESPFCGTHAWLTDAGVTSIQWGRSAATVEELKRLASQAEETNLRRDIEDREMGFTAASDCTLAEICRTAISALETGLLINDVRCFAEAMALLGTAVNYHPWEARR